jgi:hypothetical protein
MLLSGGDPTLATSPFVQVSARSGVRQVPRKFCRGKQAWPNRCAVLIHNEK